MKLVVSMGSLAMALLLARPLFGQAPLHSPRPDYRPRQFVLAGSTIDIRWDGHGVPMVSSDTDAGAFHGWGYAMAVDRFFQMEIARRSVRGRLAELLGEFTLETDPGFKDPIALDRVMRRHRMIEQGERALARIEEDHPEHFALLAAFSAGVNRYLTEKLGPPASWSNGEFELALRAIDPTFAKYPLPPDRFALWGPLDCLAANWRIAEPLPADAGPGPALLAAYEALVAGGTSHADAVAQLLPQVVLDEEGMTVRPFDMPAALLAEIEQYADMHGCGGALPSTAALFSMDPESVPSFSNGFVVGGARIAGGKRAVLVGMPQLETTKMLHEIAVRGATFNARGACYPGLPGYLSAFNTDVAWTPTSAGSSKGAFLRLAQDPGAAVPANTYVFGGATHAVERVQEQIPYRLADGSGWSTRTVNIVWAPNVHHDNASDPLRRQDVRLGVPIVQSTGGHHFAFLHYRWFQEHKESLVAYIDMLRATDVHGFGAALELYAGPAVNLLAGDKDGDVGYWYCRKVFMQACDIGSAPFGLNAPLRVQGTSDLPTDVIPLRYLPHVINPSNRMSPDDKSPLDRILLQANNSPVGAWYPLAIYGGAGDTARSFRLRELLSAKGHSGKFSAEELLSFTYDDVEIARRLLLGPAFHQLNLMGNDAFVLTHLVSVTDPQGNPLPVPAAHQDAALKMLRAIQLPQFAPDWFLAGARNHSAHPLMGGIENTQKPLRTSDYPVLTAEFGDGFTGLLGLSRALAELTELGADLYSPQAWDTLLGIDIGAQGVAELREFLNWYIGNGWTRSVLGQEYGSTSASHDPLGATPAQWKQAYLARAQNVQNGALSSPGARFRTRFLHDVFESMGSLDPSLDLCSAPLHNPGGGIGAQTQKCYVQWVHFRWHDDVLAAGAERHAYTVANIGNSNHPLSPFFYAYSKTPFASYPPDCTGSTPTAADWWLEDGIDFDPAAVLADPTIYLRAAPLQ